MTNQTHNFDPAAAMAYRADVTVDACYTDENGTEYEGEAFFISGGEWELPDSGPQFWAADVEFIGAVLYSDDCTTMIFHGHEGACNDWIERALEKASDY